VKIAAVEWDAANMRHFNEHGRCARREVEEVLFARYHPTRMATEERRGVAGEIRRLFIGRTRSGRYLAVVATPRAEGVLRPITCWTMHEEWVERYEAWRKTVKR
jgi:uncharacterized DUF497 family protein